MRIGIFLRHDAMALGDLHSKTLDIF